MEEKYLEKSLLSRRPPGLSPMLSEVLDDIIEPLAKNATPLISQHMLTPLKKYCKPGTSLDGILHNAHFLKDASASLHRSTLRRAAVGSLWKGAVNRILWQCPGSDDKAIKRQRKCAPMGFSSLEGQGFPCKSLFCPHCHCRSALSMSDRISQSIPWSDPKFMVLRVEIPFHDTVVGFDPVPSIWNRKVRTALENTECVCVRIAGATLNDRVPYSVESYLVISSTAAASRVRTRLSKIRTAMSFMGHIARLRNVATKDKAVAMAYKCCPLALIGMSKTTDANSMLHTLDSYQTAVYKAKRVHCCAGSKIFNKPVVIAPVTQVLPAEVKPIVQASPEEVAQFEDTDTLDDLSSIAALKQFFGLIEIGETT